MHMTLVNDEYDNKKDANTNVALALYAIANNIGCLAQALDAIGLQTVLRNLPI